MASSYDIIIFIIGTFILLLFAFTLVIFLVVHKKKRYQHKLEKQQLENNYQNQLLLSKLEVQEQSFKYFSEEIHDNIGQMLSIVKMQLYSIRNSSKENEIISQANQCTNLLGKAITDLRTVSHTLNSTFITKAGLAEAIEKDLEYIRSAKGIVCTLHTVGEEHSPNDEQELLIFRIIQEATANAIKHASPTTIDIYLDYKPNGLSVLIKDNGSGFDPQERRKGDGIGLNNMYLRTELLKGTLQMESAKDKGTSVRLDIENTKKNTSS